MSSPYKTLHDSYVSNKTRSKGVLTIAVAVGCLIVLGILLGIAVLERPTSFQNHTSVEPSESTERNLFSDQCRITLVESIPRHVGFEDNVTIGIPLEKAWKDLISIATETMDVASFYWTLTGEDININSTSDLPGKDILQQFGALPSRNVSVRVVTSIPSIHTNSTDLQFLQMKGVHVRKVNFGRLTKGVLHSKFWIVDRRHIFVGSANMDWRSLSEVKELGTVIYNCSSLAEDLRKIFQAYWVMGNDDNSSLPVPWPSNFETSINKKAPLEVEADNVSSRIYLAGSPPSFCPPTRTQDLEAIHSIISEAKHYIDVSVMEYLPAVQFEHPRRYWPAIDDAIKRAAFERRVTVRMLISCGRSSNPAMLPFLDSLASMHSPSQKISIQVKLFILSMGNKTIPFSRINHSKFMVTDKAAYIGTSNWAADYFSTTAGVGLVVSQHSPHAIWKTRALQSQLRAVFERDWNSQFAVYLSDLGQHPDCPFRNGL